MNQISLITELIYKQQQHGLLDELASYRLINDAIRDKKHAEIAGSKFLLTIGKLLQLAGHALEIRSGGVLDLTSPRTQEPSHGDCA